MRRAPSTHARRLALVVTLMTTSSGCAVLALISGNADVACSDDDGCPPAHVCVAERCAPGVAEGEGEGEAGEGEGEAAAVARSCAHALRLGISASGRTILDPDDDGPRPAYVAHCEQSLAGGGWSLALKIEGDAATFAAESPLWTNDELLNASSIDPTERDEAKLPAFVEERAGSILLTLEELDDEDGLSRTSIEIGAHGPSLFSMLSASAFIPPHGAPSTLPSADQWRALVPAGALLPFCLRQGVNGFDRFGKVVRLGIAGNDLQTCGDVESSIGVGLGQSCDDDDDETIFISAGNVDPDSGTCTAMRARVYVRDDDLSDLGAAASCFDHLLAGRNQDGLYLVDVDEDGPLEASLRRCDMRTDGGGFTRVFSIDPMEEGCAAPLVRATGPRAANACAMPAGDEVTALPPIAMQLAYGEVMGVALVAQRSTMDAFETFTQSIDAGYVDGLSITRGSPREHLMTFAVGVGDHLQDPNEFQCPCTNEGTAPPAFVGAAYRCESGDPSNGEWSLDLAFDGYDASTQAGCDVEAAGGPLLVNVGETVIDAIEVRAMRNEPATDGEELAIVRLELYVR